MESFWLAETLKYMFLLFSPVDTVDREKYILNTEAHPIPLFERQFPSKYWTKKNNNKGAPKIGETQEKEEEQHGSESNQDVIGNR
jgi:mannosyl-oligosaccharide alpha-1,2-mannosidase